jgi:SAM-dependent methyltransferase
MDQAYSQLWKRLLAEERAFASSALGVELMATQQTLIQQWARGRVLDLGAGDLTYRALLLQHAHAYVGLDIEKTHPELNCVGDGEKLPFADGSFDTVFCSEVMEHTPHPWLMMREIRRVLAPGGRLILFVPFIYYLHGEPHDYYRFSPYSLQVELQANQLRALQSGRLGGLVMFLGMLMQNFWLLATYRFPVRWLSWMVNVGMGRLIRLLDKRFGMQHKFPLLVWVVASDL